MKTLLSWLVNIFEGGAVRKFVLTIGLGRLGGWLGDAASGKRGAAAKRLYWWAAGLKTLTGTILGAAAVLLATYQLDAAAEVVGTLAATLVGAGLVDKAWRSAPESYQDANLAKFLRDHAPDITALVGTCLSALTTCGVDVAELLGRFHLSCKGAAFLVTAIVTLLSWAVGEAFLKPSPRQ
jgi:hypothetical protein